MLSSFGTVILVGMFSVAGFNQRYPDFEYAAEISNESVIKSAYIFIDTDDDEYDFYIDVSFTCDFYYSSGSNDYYYEHFKLESTLNRYYQGGNTLLSSYTVSVSDNNLRPITDLDEYIYTLNWDFSNEGDNCINTLYHNTARIDISNVLCIPSGEEFTGNFHLDVNIDCTSLYYQLLDYGNMAKGYSQGYNDGYYTGYTGGKDDGYTNGYQTGYTTGYTEGSTQDETAVAIFSGIISVGLIPINFFLACLNFEVFGINIGAFVSALLTIAIVVIITRMIVSGGNGGGKE